MKQSTILAMIFSMLIPFVLCAQESANEKTPLINETSKEKISNAVMKTSSIQPVIILRYTAGDAPMNTTSKEELKNQVVKGNAITASPQRRRDKKALPPPMNLSPKEKMRMGL